MTYWKKAIQRNLGKTTLKQLVIACEDTYIVKDYFENHLSLLLAQQSRIQEDPLIQVEVWESKDNRSAPINVLNHFVSSSVKCTVRLFIG